MPNDSLPTKPPLAPTTPPARVRPPVPPPKRPKGRPLDIWNNPADYRVLERHAYQNGWRARLKDGRVINPDRERWSPERIEQELPRLAPRDS